MLDRISQRLLTLLQFTRMALVFTAISNSLCTLLLATRRAVGPEGSVVEALSWQRVVLVALISIGLYGYGMALNDIIDRRRYFLVTQFWVATNAAVLVHGDVMLRGKASDPAKRQDVLAEAYFGTVGLTA